GARDADRSTRVATLSAVESTWDPLPVDTEVARQFAHIVAALRRSGRRVPVLDALVAATAVVEDIPVVTQDRDYAAIPGVEVIKV
ncbi:MAG: PIN domain-containing protein, partial [Acidimicrobiales bacterium]